MHDVMHTMKTNLANVRSVLRAWDRPLMERKAKPVDRDEFERAHKGVKNSRYAEIKEGGKVSLFGDFAACAALGRDVVEHNIGCVLIATSCVCFLRGAFSNALLLSYSSYPNASVAMFARGI